MTFSCLCVTQNRPAFASWLLWNYQKQDHADKELVVVDSSPQPHDWPAYVRVLRCPEGSSVPLKRNLALEAAGGELVTWFDDDDWQHPNKLSTLASALEGGGLVAGCRRSWFLDLKRGRCRPFEMHQGVIFNSAGFRKSCLEGIQFDAQKRKAADTAWLSTIHRTTRRQPRQLSLTLACWLCHSENLSNPANKYVFPQPLSAVVGAVGTQAWGDTDHHLAELRGCLKV